MAQMKKIRALFQSEQLEKERRKLNMRSVGSLTPSELKPAEFLSTHALKRAGTKAVFTTVIVPESDRPLNKLNNCKTLGETLLDERDTLTMSSLSL